MFFRSLKFAAILAQLWRNKVEAQRSIELGFISNLRDFYWGFSLARFGIDRRGSKPIFIQRPTALQGATAHLDVVLFAAGEVVESERVLGRAYDPQIALDSGAKLHARLRRALRDD